MGRWSIAYRLYRNLTQRSAGYSSRVQLNDDNDDIGDIDNAPIEQARSERSLAVVLSPGVALLQVCRFTRTPTLACPRPLFPSHPYGFGCRFGRFSPCSVCTTMSPHADHHNTR